MDPFVASVTALAISTIYVVWNAYRLVMIRRQRQLRQRVAYMLWVMAQRDE